MDKIDKPVSPSLSRIKARAKAKSEAEDLSLGQALRLASQAAGFENYRAARLAKAPSQIINTVAPPRPAAAYSAPPAAFSPCHWVVIGGHCWYLEIGRQGPELWRRPPGGLAAVRVSQLGIFQTLCRNVAKDVDGRDVVAWSTARYGCYDHQTLAPWTDQDAEALSAHFGLPVVHEGWLPWQKELSEELFLRSRAFAALRQLIRAGGLRPAFGTWNYGLTNFWNLLVALPDEVFADMGQEVVVAMFDQARRGGSPKLTAAWRKVSDALKAAWPEFVFDDAELQEQIAALLPRKLGQRMRAHLDAAAAAETESAR